MLPQPGVRGNLQLPRWHSAPLHVVDPQFPKKRVAVENVYGIMILYILPPDRPPMRTNIDIDDSLMAEARKAYGNATKKQTVENALRLVVKLDRQREVAAAFGKYRWRGNLARSRKGRATE